MKSSYPTYLDYLTVLKEQFRTIGKKIPLQDFNMQGNSTNLNVVLKEHDGLQASQPYMQVTFIRAMDGHDDSQSRSKGLGYIQT